MGFTELLQKGILIGSTIIVDVFTSPVNLILLVVCVFLFYKILKHKTPVEEDNTKITSLPSLNKDLTLTELRQYDGSDEYNRILIAVNGKIFDVTKNGKEFYGPGGPYALFAGRDASRGLATFSLDSQDCYDDLSDLSTDQMERLKEWEIQFSEKYEYVGKLLRPGEVSTNYLDIDSEDDKDALFEGDDGTLTSPSRPLL